MYNILRIVERRGCLTTDFIIIAFSLTNSKVPYREKDGHYYLYITYGQQYFAVYRRGQAGGGTVGRQTYL